MRFLREPYNRLRYWYRGIRIDNKDRVENVLGHAVSAIEQAEERLKPDDAGHPPTYEDFVVAISYLRQAREILDFV